MGKALALVDLQYFSVRLRCDLVNSDVECQAISIHSRLADDCLPTCGFVPDDAVDVANHSCAVAQCRRPHPDRPIHDDRNNGVRCTPALSWHVIGTIDPARDC